jgi:hypothetical protein
VSDARDVPAQDILNLLPLLASRYARLVLSDRRPTEVGRVRRAAQAALSPPEEVLVAVENTGAALSAFRDACGPAMWRDVLIAADALADWQLEDEGYLVRAVVRSVREETLSALPLSGPVLRALWDLKKTGGGSTAGLAPADVWDSEYEFDHPELHLDSVAAALELVLATLALQRVLADGLPHEREALSQFIRANPPHHAPEEAVSRLANAIRSGSWLPPR